VSQGTINYVKGDATVPQTSGMKVIGHICNDHGRWGKGFVLALSQRWQTPELEYRQWHQAQKDFALGEVQFVEVNAEIIVANMIGQHGIKASGKQPPIRYEALAVCLDKVAAKARELNASVHLPRIGCGLAGGTWEKIEPLIRKHLVAEGLEVYVYDL